MTSTLRVEIAPGGDPDDDSTWEWIDITDPWLVEPVTITRGRTDESSSAAPASVTMTLRNDDGRFSTRNPLGPWYGRLGLNTPLRVLWDGQERFVGFLSELPTAWAGIVDVSRAAIRADGIIRRLDQGAQPLSSALTRSWVRRPDVVAYWPCEEGSDATSAASPIEVVSPIRPSGVDFGAGQDHPAGSAPAAIRVPEGGGGVLGAVPSHPSTDSYVASDVVLIAELDSSSRDLLNVLTIGRAVRWRIAANSTNVVLTAFDSDGSSLVNETVAVSPLLADRWLFIQLGLGQVGSGVSWSYSIHTADVDRVLLNSDSGTLSSATLGRVTNLGLGLGIAGANAPDRFVSHIALMRRNIGDPVSVFDPAVIHGYTGERAADRFERLCEEEGMACTIVGDPDTSMPMGPQPVASLMAQFRDVEATDGGILTDNPLTYRTRESLYNQAAVMHLGESDVVGSPRAPDDDRYIRNDVTAGNPGGSSARVVNEAHVQRFGRYDKSVAVNVSDNRLEMLAAHEVHLGTTDEIRWLGIGVRVHPRSPDLEADWLALRVGDRMTLENCYPQLPGMDIDTLTQGWSEELRSNPDDVRLEINTTPARPWNVFEVEAATFGRVWSPRPYLGEDVDDDDTSFDVVVPVQRALNSAPGFENPITVEAINVGSPQSDDWQVEGSGSPTLERSADVAFTGRWSGRWVPTTGTGGLKAIYAASLHAVARDRTYRASAWLYAPAGGFDVRVDLIFWSSGWTLRQITSTSLLSMPSGQWVRLAVSAQAPSVAAVSQPIDFATVSVTNPSASTSHILHVDDAEVGVPGAPFTTDSGDFPQDIVVGGERMTVTGVGADDGTGRQVFTVTRAVNGVVKSHPAGTPVRMYPGHVVAL